MFGIDVRQKAWSAGLIVLFFVAWELFHPDVWAIAPWILLMLYFLIDDALLAHEQVGFWYFQQSWAFGIGPISSQSLGELAFSALVEGLNMLARRKKPTVEDKVLH